MTAAPAAYLNIAVEPTPNSLRSYLAAAIGRGSPPAFGFCCMLRGRRMITIFHDKDDPEAQAKFERWRQTTSHGYYINYRSRSNLMIHRVGCPHDTPWHQKWGSLTRTKKMLLE